MVLINTSPCVKGGKCQMHYPKDFQEITQVSYGCQVKLLIEII